MGAWLVRFDLIRFVDLSASVGLGLGLAVGDMGRKLLLGGVILLLVSVFRG